MRSNLEVSVPLLTSLFSDGDKPAHRITQGIPEGAKLVAVELVGDPSTVEGDHRVRFIYEADELPPYISPLAETLP